MKPEDWSTARELRREHITDAQTSNFWQKVDRWSGPCWDFFGHINAGGYGQVGIGTKRSPRSVLAHRMSHALEVGPVPDGLYVLHSCDRRTCVTPAHLSLGTHEENQRQKAERGRVNNLAGDANPRSRLSSEDVRRMRVEYAALVRGQKLAYRERMASRLGVSERAIEAAIGGESWSGVT